MMELEDRQLDFNQPLLTVRRFLSTVVPSETRGTTRIDRTAANLPPLPRYKSDLKSGPVRNPGTVPFIWEQIPGRPKDGGKSLNPTLNARVVPPKPPPGKNSKQTDSNKGSREVEADSAKNYVQEYGSSVTCERVDDAVKEKADSGSEIDDDDAFLDALETFSRSESQCLSCSVSGLCEVYDMDSKLSGKFSEEPPAREFMMGRFLPAAKAMASEAPANVIRKPRAEKHKPRHLTNVTNESKITELYHGRFVNDRYALGEASEDDFDEYENPSANMCGLLPWFGLSNAVSSVGIHTARSTYPLRRFQVKPSYTQHRGETCCRDGDLVIMRKSAGGVLEVEQHANKSAPKAISSYPISENDGKTLQIQEAVKRPDSCSSQAKRICVDNSFKDIAVIESSVTEEPRKRQERHCMSFRQLLASEGCKWESDSQVHSSSDSKVIDKAVSVSDESDEKKINVTSKSTDDDDASVNSSFAEITSLDIPRKSAPPSSGTADSAESSPMSAYEEVDGETSADVVKQSQVEAEATSTDNEGKIDLEGEIHLKSREPFPIPPPLPKSPSDSWLSRTLPSVWSKKSGQGHGFAAANAFSKVQPPPKPPASVDPKWETIVKTSKVDRGHLRFSEELLAPIPESCAVEHRTTPA